MNNETNHQATPWEELEKKVEFLKKTEAYEKPCKKIEAIETHMSWVFLTEEHAFKLKKPIQYSFLDLRKLDARYLNCLCELEINQDLAPGFYIEATALCQNKQQFYPVGQDIKGKVVDWLLKMQRFPQDKTLKQQIKQDKIDETKLREAALILARFYKQSAPEKIKNNDYRKRLNRYVTDNFNALTRSQYGLDQIQVQAIHSAQFHLLCELSDELEQREMQGKIIDCHGDLRPEHICLISPPIFVDRLEFDPELRKMDPVDELSYLTLECDLLGRADIGEFFFDVYQKKTNDQPSAKLLSFYQSLRACVRAKISAWHLDDPRVSDKDKWQRNAKKYLQYAAFIL
ncbi:hypothetical protein E3983_12440 [Legionella israelensis]|uniref:Aminoglycoside phosphotransferase domain-containing protein n=1 Tax=Legionella israelensis TaxID=454 RepID=A0AAX1EIW1_9GAMM|nr:hypothetical protein [Legionella israelensis]QBR85086.1 hypothetical protein E3983_12440 [Legionella israelensis]